MTEISNVDQSSQQIVSDVGDVTAPKNSVVSHFNNNQAAVTYGTAEGRAETAAGNAPALEQGEFSGTNLFSLAQSMIYEIAKLQIERTANEKISRREDRKQVVQDQIDQSKKMEEAAANRKTSQLISGSLSIAGGVVAMGIGVGAARAASSGGAGGAVASKASWLSPITSKLAPIANNTGSALIVGQSITTLSDGLGQVSSANYEYKASMADADVRKLEAFETAHRSVVQDEDERIDQSMKILDKSLDQISKLTDQHAESQKNANRV
jgi:hypothetical protein